MAATLDAMGLSTSLRAAEIDGQSASRSMADPARETAVLDSRAGR
jgi:hypothetical protein